MSDPRHYILDASGRPVVEPDFLKWAAFFEDAKNRVVAQHMVGSVKVSTVFLGLDHQYGDGPPILWETMVFGGPLNGEMQRCAGSREQAEAMHAEMACRVFASDPP